MDLTCDDRPGFLVEPFWCCSCTGFPNIILERQILPRTLRPRWPATDWKQPETDWKTPHPPPTFSLTNRVAQEPKGNRKQEPSEPFFPKPTAEPEPPEPFSRNRNQNRNRPFLVNCTETQKSLFAEEPPEPKTETAWTVPYPNRNRTEPNPWRRW